VRHIFADTPVADEGREVSAASAVILVHGLRSDANALENEARAFEAAGLRPVLVDAPHHGARRDEFLETMPDTSTVEGYRRLLVILREGRDDVSRLVDRLYRMQYQRVSVFGVSMGAYIALAVATMDPRIRAIVSVLGSPDWTPPDQDPAPFEEALRDSPHLFAERFPPRALMMLNGSRDENVRPEGARALAAVLRPRYEALGIADKLVHREWDVPHFVPEETWREMIAMATDFLARHSV
jgi:pimeloyl-ACP methyl ester carboxylesterase